MSTRPRTKYLLIKGDIVVGEYYSLYDIGFSLGITLDQQKYIIFAGEAMSSYSEEWTNNEAVADWVNRYMVNNRFHGYKVYRYICA